MACRLEKSEPGILADNMEDGDIAIVLQWSTNNIPVGTIVQRLGNAMIVLGEGHGKQCSTFFNTSSSYYRVRVLNPGETICIE